jgi:hypothetical protein
MEITVKIKGATIKDIMNGLSTVRGQINGGSMSQLDENATRYTYKMEGKESFGTCVTLDEHEQLDMYGFRMDNTLNDFATYKSFVCLGDYCNAPVPVKITGYIIKNLDIDEWYSIWKVTDVDGGVYACGRIEETGLESLIRMLNSKFNDFRFNLIELNNFPQTTTIEG